MYLHNNNTRLTVIHSGTCSYTFPIPSVDDFLDTDTIVRYYIEDEDLIGVFKKNEGQESDFFIQTHISIDQSKSQDHQHDTGYSTATS